MAGVSEDERIGTRDEIERALSFAVRMSAKASEDWLDSFIRLLVGLFDADRGYLFMLSDDMKSLVNMHSYCTGGAEMSHGLMQEFPFDTFPYFAGEISSKRPVILASTEGLPHNATTEAESLRKHGVKSLILMPLIICDTPTGFIGVDIIRKERHWTPHEIGIMESAARAASLVIERKSSYHSLAAETEKLSRDIRKYAM